MKLIFKFKSEPHLFLFFKKVILFYLPIYLIPMDSLSISTLCRYITLFLDKFIQTLPQPPPYHLLSQWHSLKSLLKSIPIPLESLHNLLSDMLGCERKASLDFLEKIMNPVSVTTPFIHFDASNEKLKQEIKGIKEESPRQTVGKSITKMSPKSNQASMKKKPNLFNDVTETAEIVNKITELPQNPFFLKKRPTMLNDIPEKTVPGHQPRNYRSNTAFFITPQHRNFPNPFLPFHREKQQENLNNNSTNFKMEGSFNFENNDEIREDNNKTARDYWEKDSPMISKNTFGDGVGYMGFSIKMMKVFLF